MPSGFSVPAIPTSPRSDPTPLLLYDGECGLCNACVRMLLRIDKTGTMRFAPLQGPTAQGILRARGLPMEDFDSLVLIPDFPREDGPQCLRTDGVLRVLAEVGGIWRVVSWLRIIPAGLRDFFYKLVARMRHRLFGKYLPRPLANPEWTARFLP